MYDDSTLTLRCHILTMLRESSQPVSKLVIYSRFQPLSQINIDAALNELVEDQLIIFYNTSWPDGTETFAYTVRGSVADLMFNRKLE